MTLCEHRTDPWAEAPIGLELLTELVADGQLDPTPCGACMSSFEAPSDDSLRYIAEAGTPLPAGLGDLIRAERAGDPQPGEVWRVGRSEAMLVWVRRVFDDGMADVVPLVLDVDFADDESILVPADAVGVELAAMVAVRTHIDVSVFINRIGSIDLDNEVAEVMTAVREGRPPRGVPVGSPIEDDADQRIAYRQAIRRFFAALTPGQEVTA